MVDFDTDIKTLNHLLAVTIDSADGYEQAAEATDDRELAMIFRRFGAERGVVLTTLRRQIRVLGFVSPTDAVLLAGGHRVFLRVKSVIDASFREVMEAVETGEEHIRRQYEAALRQVLTAETRRVVEIAYGSVREGHDSFSAMKHSYVH